MAFTNTKRRYASFGTVESIPGDIINLFWYLIDNDLKDTFSLSTVLNFELLQRQNGRLSVRFSQDDTPSFSIIFDSSYLFDRRWPRLFHAVDNTGRETIITAEEMI